MPPGGKINIGNKERLSALLCVLVVAASVIFGLMYLLGVYLSPLR
jgi:hypothetical protein